MAQTITGVFRIVDRATGPLRKMEEQAKRTDKAFRSLGMSMDDSATREQGRRYEESERHIRNLGRASRSTDKDFDRLGRRTDDLTTRLAKLGGAFYGLSKIFNILKIPAMIAGVTLLVKWVGALAGGVVALLPKMTDLVGVVGAAPIAFTGLGLAVGAVKLAFNDFSKALGGNKEALKGLTPEAKQFLATVKQYQPVMKDLRRSAQQGLFPGLDAALRRAQRGVPMLQRLLGRAGSAVGFGVQGLATSFTGKNFLRDFERIGNEGTNMVRRLFVGIENLGHAFVNVGVAAIPFTRWLEKTVLHGTELIRVWAANGRESGRLGNAFDRTRKSLQTFGSILGNVWRVFRGIGRASRSLGDDLWKSADKATEKWAAWTNSVEGQSTLREFFDNIRGTLHETFGLVGDISKAVFRLSNDRSMAGLIAKLRTMVPLLEKIMGNTAEQLGGPLLDAVKGFLTIFSNTPYFGNFITLLAQMSNLVGWLTSNLPAMGPLIMGITAYKIFAPAIDGVRQLAAGWGLVATNAGAAAAATSAATGASAGAGLAGGGRGGLGLRRRMQSYQIQRQAFGASRGQALGTAMAGMGMGARMAGGAAARAFWPIAALFGLSGFVGTKSNVGDRLQGGLSAATMGLIPAPETGAMSRDKGTAAAQALLGRDPSRAHVTGRIAALQRSLSAQDTTYMSAGGVATAVGTHNRLTGDGRDRAAAQLRELQKALPGIIRGAIRSRQERSTDNAHRSAQDIQSAYGFRAQHYGAGKALGMTIGATRDRMAGRRSIVGREAMGQDMLSWAADLEKHGGPKDAVERMEKAVLRSMRRLNKNVRIVNGEILTGTKTEWSGIRSALTTEVERARQGAERGFSAIQRQAIGSLQAMGFSKSDAQSLVRGMQAGGERGRVSRSIAASGDSSIPIPSAGSVAAPRAKGGRIVGRGLNDTVPVGGRTIAAPGELIVNRHTENRIDRVLRPFGTSLGLEVGREGRPHNMPGGIFKLNRPEKAALGRRQRGDGAGGLGAGFQGGGIVALGRYLQSLGYAVGEHPAFGGVAPVHTANSYHYKGMALDVNADSMAGGEVANLTRLNSWLNSNRSQLGIAELLWQVKGHFDHLHVAMGGAGGPVSGISGVTAASVGGGAAQQMRALRAPRSGARGAPGAMADRANQIYAAGMTKAINRKLRRRAGGAGGGAGGGGGTAGATTFGGAGDPGTGSQGYRGDDLNTLWDSFAELNMGTAMGGLPYMAKVNVSVPSTGKSMALYKRDIGAGGGPINGKPRQIDLWHKAATALGLPPVWSGTVNWQRAATGARVGDAGWFGTGGTVTAHGPTVLGIGESGTETATITRGKSGGGGGGGVRIGKLIIQNHRPGDVRKQIEREVEQAFNNLADTLDVMPAYDDTEVLD